MSTLRARYLRQLDSSARDYVELIVYAMASREDDGVELPAANLDLSQQEIVDALHADGEIAPTLRVMREGNQLLIDTDLRLMTNQTRSEEIDAPTAPGESGAVGTKTGDVRPTQRAIYSSQEWDRLGDKLLTAQRLVDAYLCYLIATLREPDEATYICDVARIFSRASRPAAARELLARGFEGAPHSPYVLVEIAHFYDITRKEEEIGSLLYRKAIVNGNRSSTAPYYLAMNLHKKEQHRHAYLACLEACAMDPENDAKQSLLRDYTRNTGLPEPPPGPRTADDLEAELAQVKSSGEYPVALSEEEERRLAEHVTARPEADLAASQLSRPPF